MLPLRSPAFRHRLIPSFPAVALAALCGAVCAVGMAHPATGCSDDFSAAALSSDWTFLDKDGVAGGSAQVGGGVLALTGRGRDAFNDINEFVGVERAPLQGDFDVSVEIVSQTNTNGWAQAGILAANDPSDPSRGGYVIADVTPSNGNHLFWDASGTQGTLDKHADAGTSAYPVWLRLVRAGNKFSAYYKNQAQAAWTSIVKDVEPQGLGPDSRVALVSLSHNDSADGKAVFDDFTCAGTQVTGVLPYAGEASRRAYGVFHPGGLWIDAAGTGIVSAGDPGAGLFRSGFPLGGLPSGRAADMLGRALAGPKVAVPSGRAVSVGDGATAR